MFAFNRRHLASLLFLASVLLAVGWFHGRVSHSSSPTGVVIFVDHAATGNGDGSTWEHAYPSLQSALTAATSGDEIWVAQGVYKPTNTTDRTISFVMKNGVALYGGFAATETLRTERDWENNLTVLSGDIDNNDLTDPHGVVTDTTNIVGNNSYHVVLSDAIDNSSVLDGFTITAGLANGTYIAPCGPKCGGGLNNVAGHLNLTNLVFSGNYTSGSGGGMYSNAGNLNLTNITFNGNHASGNGGGMLVAQMDITLRDVNFRDNQATLWGGGLAGFHVSLTLIDVTFHGNKAMHGGGAFFQSGQNASRHDHQFVNVLFSGNEATYAGGGVANLGDNPTFINTTFSGNHAVSGGGMYNTSIQATPWANNTEEGSNHHTQPEPHSTPTPLGASSQPHQSNTSLPASPTPQTSLPHEFNNSEGYYANNVLLFNVIFWNNEDNSGVGTANSSLVNAGIGSLIVHHSLVHGCNPEGMWVEDCGINGGGNLADADPLFVEPPDPANAPTTAGNLRLQLGSPAVDAGNDSYLPPDVTTDLDGNPRIIGSAVDLGPYEFDPGCPAAGVAYVDAAATGANNGTSWADAFTDLQTPLDLVMGSCEIWVAQGVYKPTNTPDRTISFVMKNCVALYGGFAATETLRTERDWESNITVLSGDIDNNDLTDPHGVVTDTANIVGNNSFHVVQSNGVNATGILDGFTITSGQANIYPDRRGGGMYVIGGNPSLSNLTFRGNMAIYSGAGLYSQDSNLTLHNANFRKNRTLGGGGGLANNGGSITLVGVDFSENHAPWGGGMFHALDNGTTLVNVTFHGNQAEMGGGFANLSAAPTLNNVVFSGNVAQWYGGGLVNERGNPVLNNVTFSGNQALQGGGAYNSTDPVVPTPHPGPYHSSSDGEQMGDNVGDVPHITSTPTPSSANTDQPHTVAARSPSPEFMSASAFYEAGNDNRVALSMNSNPLFQNVIFWNNEDDSGVGTAASSFVNEGTGNATFRYSLIQGCNPSGVWVATCGTDGGHNLADADPLFVDVPNPSIAPHTEGNVRLLANSPAIDAGDNAVIVVTTDLDGNPRIMGTAVDLGPYEYSVSQYLIHPHLIGQGTITLLPHAPAYTWGTVITATAVPHLGWSFAHWSGDLSGTANPITFTVQGHATLTATFTNDPPTAEAGPHQTVLTNASVTLDGRGSYDDDPDQPLSYGWVQTGGPEVTLSASTAVSPTFTAPASRTVLTFTLTVTDSLGLPSTPDEVVVTVQEPSMVTHLHATPITAEVGQTITYTLVITNDGDVLLSGLSVTATLATNFDPPPTLAMGDSVSLVATYTVQADDLPGPLTNQVWVVAEADGEQITAVDTAVVLLITPPPPVPRYTIYLPLVIRQ